MKYLGLRLSDTGPDQSLEGSLVIQYVKSGHVGNFERYATYLESLPIDGCDFLFTNYLETRQVRRGNEIGEVVLVECYFQVLLV